MEIGEIYDGSVYRCVRQSPDLLELQDKGTISAGDGVRYETLPGLAELRTRQAVSALGFLKRHGLPVAYNGQLDSTTLSLDYVDMIPLEVVVRHGMMGSELERNPGMKPHWAKKPMVQFFYKKAYDKRVGGFIDGNALRKEGAAEIKRLKDEKIVFPDPYMDILGTGNDQWLVYDAHAPLDMEAALTQLTLDCPRVEMIKLALTAFDMLAERFAAFDYSNYPLNFNQLLLADIKFEFGIRRRDGRLLMGDTVTLDSMRLLMDGKFDKGHQLSKQVFRDEAKLPKVMATYRMGTMLMEAIFAD